MTNYDEMPPYIHENSCQDFQNINASRILRDITFVRLCLESICMNEEDEFIVEVIRRRSLFGFILEYQFPSIDAASTSLKARVRIHAKHFNGNIIHFRHKRVIRIKMIPELVNLWKRSPLLLAVYAKLNTLGKYSMKKLGSCEVPLEELIIPPFIICRDFLFVGPGFSASALIKIDLGSHIRLLMERLEWMRNGSLPQSGSATRARSRSSSRKGSVYASSRLTPSLPQRRAFSSSPPLLRPFPPPLVSSSPRDTVLSSPYADNTPRAAIRELCPTSPSYRIKLTVYSARRLPLSFNSRGDAVAPSTYLTVIGEDGRTLSSPVRAGTLHPEWNWTETFNVSRSRQNLVVKLWKRCIVGSDKVIGFISLQLPPADTGKSEYEMSDLSVSNQAPLITLSISCETLPHAESYDKAPLLVPLSSPLPLKPLLSETSPRLQKMTSEEIFEKLR
ncbi:C2 domain-containing protein [Loa loa]|uniref:C2 domain-containing protein n=1 Tax=Loa loa TaxID=7209 RepID=A0A1S0U2X7_LOALO|nr:C2 domain-containing protein [Loa loa]EFO24185.1 C2 domain-containing protein [Loa loa]